MESGPPGPAVGCDFNGVDAKGTLVSGLGHGQLHQLGGDKRAMAKEFLRIRNRSVVPAGLSIANVRHGHVNVRYGHILTFLNKESRNFTIAL